MPGWFTHSCWHRNSEKLHSSISEEEITPVTDDHRRGGVQGKGDPTGDGITAKKLLLCLLKASGPGGSPPWKEKPSLSENSSQLQTVLILPPAPSSLDQVHPLWTYMAPMGKVVLAQGTLISSQG